MHCVYIVCASVHDPYRLFTLFNTTHIYLNGPTLGSKYNTKEIFKTYFYFIDTCRDDIPHKVGVHCVYIACTSVHDP